MSRFDSIYEQELTRRASSQRLRVLEPLEPLGPVRVRRRGRVVINFSSNNYLGLSHHPQLVARAREWTERWGCGSGASRLVSGTFELHAAIENRLAELKRAEAALIFNSGYQANSSLLPALFDRRMLGGEALVFSDELIHASLHQGCAAAGIKQIRFRHNDLQHLEALLEQHALAPGRRFILTESVFSMDGDVVDLPSLLDIAQQHDAFVVLDEAHATGVLGPAGMGLSVAFPGRVDLVLGTFGKALGSFGAYVACSRVLRDYLINRCGGLIYSTALPPPVLGAIDAALDLVPALEPERQQLHERARRLREFLAGEGLSTLASSTQIVPLVLGGAEEALRCASLLLERDLLGVAIRPPSVPAGTSRIRLALSAAHDDDDLERLIAALRQIIQQRSGK